MHRAEMVHNSRSLPVLGRLTVDDKTGYRHPSSVPMAKGKNGLEVTGCRSPHALSVMVLAACFVSVPTGDAS